MARKMLKVKGQKLVIDCGKKCKTFLNIFIDNKFRLESFFEVGDMGVIKSEDLEEEDPCTIQPAVAISQRDSASDSENADLNNIGEAYKKIRPDIKLTKPIKCKFCDRPFQYVMTLKKHLRKSCTDKPTTTFECWICLSKFQYAWKLKIHIESHLDKDNPNKCMVCRKMLGTFHSLKSHYIAAHGTQDQREDLRSKQQEVKRNLRAQCMICSKLFSTKQIMLLHHTREHGCVKEKKALKLKQRSLEKKRKDKLGLLPCYFCQRPFFEKEKHKKHLYTHTKEVPHKCTLCEERFSYYANLSIHVVEKHGTEAELALLRLKNEKSVRNKKGFTCYFCQKPFKQFPSISQHVKLKHTQELLRKECAKCQKVFFCERRLKIHQNTVCSSDEEARRLYLTLRLQRSRQLYCYFCRKLYKENTPLNQHLRSHTLEIPYKCAKCNKSFKWLSSLNNHSVFVCKTEVSEKAREAALRYRNRIKMFHQKRKNLT